MEQVLLKAISKKCLDCSGSEVQVKNCIFKDCQLYEFRLGKNTKNIKLETQIKKYCLDCSGNSEYNREKCVSVKCPLYKYRLGKTTNGVNQTNKHLF